MKPIIFNSEMVRATLDDLKTQTRWVIKFELNELHGRGNPVQLLGDWPLSGCAKSLGDDGRLHYEFQTEVDDSAHASIKCPYGVPGDLLWVRETFWINHYGYFNGERLPKEKPQCLIDDPDLIMYNADGSCCYQLIECECGEVGKPKLRPSIHMPRWASRLTLKIKDIRVERVQDISAEDALNEGIQIEYNKGSFPENIKKPEGYDKMTEAKKNAFVEKHARATYMSHLDDCDKCIKEFKNLWNSINEKRGFGWDANPWVWVVEFERVKRVSIQQQLTGPA